MSKVEVDCERLAQGLENGLDPSGFSCFRELYLRLPMCGLVSTAVMLYMREQGVQAEMVISEPKLPFDPCMEHVMVAVPDQPETPFLIDATFGQFLQYTGYDIAYQHITKQQIYPHERVIAFGASERLKIVSGIAKSALKFRDIEYDLITGVGYEWGHDWIPEIKTEQELVQAIEPIWNSANFHPYEADKATLCQGRKLSKFISKNAVTLVDL
jgi:hypothetical protein